MHTKKSSSQSLICPAFIQEGVTQADEPGRTCSAY